MITRHNLCITNSLPTFDHQDQLLEIVQSFQLDTTMAGHEQNDQNMDLGSLIQQAESALVQVKSIYTTNLGKFHIKYLPR